MADVLQKIQRLLALSTSSNENEARSAALAAARLIREFEVVLTLPGQRLDLQEVSPTTEIVRHPKGPKVRDRYNFEWTFHEEWGGGGNCTFCGLPCFRGNAAYQSEECGLIHLLCWTSRQTGKSKPGPAPPPRPPPPPKPIPEERKQRAIDDFWDHFEKMRER